MREDRKDLVSTNIKTHVIRRQVYPRQIWAIDDTATYDYDFVLEFWLWHPSHPICYQAVATNTRTPQRYSLGMRTHHCPFTSQPDKHSWAEHSPSIKSKPTLPQNITLTARSLYYEWVLSLSTLEMRWRKFDCTQNPTTQKGKHQWEYMKDTLDVLNRLPTHMAFISWEIILSCGKYMEDTPNKTPCSTQQLHTLSYSWDEK